VTVNQKSPVVDIYVEAITWLYQNNKNALGPFISENIRKAPRQHEELTSRVVRILENPDYFAAENSLLPSSIIQEPKTKEIEANEGESDFKDFSFGQMMRSKLEHGLKQPEVHRRPYHRSEKNPEWIRELCE
jgi:hypothetical protein